MAYSCNIQPAKTWFVGIMLNKYTIMSRRTMPPRVYGSNPFTKHPPCARQVTWGIINGNCRRKNTDFGCVGKDRTIRQRNIIELNVCINLYQLFVEEAPNEVGKMRDIEMDSKSFNSERKISNCTGQSGITEQCKIILGSLGHCARITSLSTSPSMAPQSSSSSSGLLVSGSGGGSSGGPNRWPSIPRA